MPQDTQTGWLYSLRRTSFDAGYTASAMPQGIQSGWLYNLRRTSFNAGYTASAMPHKRRIGEVGRNQIALDSAPRRRPRTIAQDPSQGPLDEDADPATKKRRKPVHVCQADAALSHASLIHPNGLRIKAVELMTTGFQSSAVGIYESFGWKRVKTDLGAPGRWWLDWYCVHYRLELGDKYYDRVA